MRTMITAAFLLTSTLVGCAEMHQRAPSADHGAGQCCTSCHVYRQGGLHLGETAPCAPGSTLPFGGDAGVPAAWLADGGR